MATFGRTAGLESLPILSRLPQLRVGQQSGCQVVLQILVLTVRGPPIFSIFFVLRDPFFLGVSTQFRPIPICYGIQLQLAFKLWPKKRTDVLASMALPFEGFSITLADSATACNGVWDSKALILSGNKINGSLVAALGWNHWGLRTCGDCHKMIICWWFQKTCSIPGNGWAQWTARVGDEQLMDCATSRRDSGSFKALPAPGGRDRGLVISTWSELCAVSPVLLQFALAAYLGPVSMEMAVFGLFVGFGGCILRAPMVSGAYEMPVYWFADPWKLAPLTWFGNQIWLIRASWPQRLTEFFPAAADHLVPCPETIFVQGKQFCVWARKPFLGDWDLPQKSMDGSGSIYIYIVQQRYLWRCAATACAKTHHRATVEIRHRLHLTKQQLV